MAIVKTPFLSLGASGSIANTLTAQRNRSRDTMRSMPVPTNPRSPAQCAHRAVVAKAVHGWRYTLTLAPGVDEPASLGWNRYASHLKTRAAGYHLAVKSMVKTYQLQATAQYVVAAHTIGNALAVFLLDPYTSAPVAEPGPFDLFAGRTPQSLRFVIQDVFGAGSYSFPAWWPTHQYDPYYIQIFVNGLPRSGVYRLGNM